MVHRVPTSPPSPRGRAVVAGWPSAAPLWVTSAIRVCAGALAVSPVLFNPWGFDEYQLPKLLLGTLAVVLGLVVVFRRGFVVSSVLVASAIFLLAVVVAACVSRSPRVAFFGSDSRHFGVLTWAGLVGAMVLGSAMSTARDREWLINVLVGSSAVVAAYALAQRVGLDAFHGWVKPSRPGSTLGSATFAGGYLAFSFAICLASVALRPRRWMIAVAVVDASGLLISQSRGAWLAAAAGLAVALTWVSRRTSWRTAARYLAVAVAVSVSAVLLVPGFGARLGSLAHPSAGTAGGRLALAGMGIRAIEDRPFFGWGPDLSRPALHAQIAIGFERRYGDARIEDRVHNVFLDLAVWSGILGLAAFIWLMVVVVRSIRAHGGIEWTVSAVALGLFAYMVNLFFNFPVPEVDSVVWMFAGTVALSTSRSRRVVVPTYVSGAIAVVALVGVGGRLVDGLQADRALRHAVDAESAGNAGVARSEYRLAWNQSRTPTYGEAYARFSLRQSDTATAVSVLSLARVDSGDDPYLDELYATALNARAEQTSDQHVAAEAIAILRDLIAESPNDASLHANLAISYRIVGRPADAAREKDLADALR
jgi:O-antigen ligase